MQRRHDAPMGFFSEYFTLNPLNQRRRQRAPIKIAYATEKLLHLQVSCARYWRSNFVLLGTAFIRSKQPISERLSFLATFMGRITPN
jgi:hypothetical protein